MPGIWKRIEHIFAANAHANLDEMENPAHMSQHILRELDQELDQLRQQLVAAVSREHKIKHSLTAITNPISAHQNKARTALSNGDEALAKHHLSLQLKLQQEASQLQELAGKQQRWSEALRNERTALLREREELSSQARIVSLRAGLNISKPGASKDLYSQSLQRRERMARYSASVDNGFDELIAAQTLRAEELGDMPSSSDLDIDAAMNALKLDITQEHAA